MTEVTARAGQQDQGTWERGAEDARAAHRDHPETQDPVSDGEETLPGGLWIEDPAGGQTSKQGRLQREMYRQRIFCEIESWLAGYFRWMNR